MKNVKKSFILLVVLALVSAPAFSLPLLDRISSKLSASDSLVELPQEEPAEAQDFSQEQPVESSEKASETTLTQLSGVLTDLETVSRLSKSQLNELISQLEVIKAQYEVLVADYEAKEAALDEQMKINDEQADALARELKSKFFGDVGAAFGYMGSELNLGITADIGMRFGKGLITKVGATYMLGNLGMLTSGQHMYWKDALVGTVSVGWEW